MAINEEVLRREIEERHECTIKYKSEQKEEKQLVKLIPAAIADATTRMHELDWPDSSEERVRTYRFMRRGEKQIRLALVRGEAFTSLFATYDLRTGESCWLGEDGQLYELNPELLTLEKQPAVLPPAFIAHDARYGYSRPAVLLEALQDLGR